MTKDNQISEDKPLKNIFGKLRNNKTDSQKFKDEIREEEKRDFERM
jgi:hypothetical protein